MAKKMVTRKTWKEFRKSGLLWFINSMLHAFGWAIVFYTKEDGTLEVYPARVRFRGFDTDTNTKGYITLSLSVSSK